MLKSATQIKTVFMHKLDSFKTKMFKSFQYVSSYSLLAPMKSSKRACHSQCKLFGLPSAFLSGLLLLKPHWVTEIEVKHPGSSSTLWDILSLGLRISLPLLMVLSFLPPSPFLVFEYCSAPAFSPPSCSASFFLFFLLWCFLGPSHLFFSPCPPH